MTVMDGTTGIESCENEWSSEVAVSSYADMLHDDERNRAYYQAIRLCVGQLVKSSKYNPDGDRFFNCCDIGTGSGLLSLMVTQAFLDLDYTKFHVIAFESFIPMAECAKNIIAANGRSEHITVLPIKSDSYRGGIRFDLLVAELLDTEFIGERCLEIYLDAIKNLCTPECLFVPYKGRIYIEPIASTSLYERHRYKEQIIRLRDDKFITLRCPQATTSCTGQQQVDDMQVGMLKENIDFVRISEPQVAFEFKLDDPRSLKLLKQNTLRFNLNKKTADELVVVMWWDLVMYDRNLVDDNLHQTDTSYIDLEIISMAPTWAKSPELIARDEMVKNIYGRDVWREHWIQGIYYLEGQVDYVKLSDTMELMIYAYHDNCSMWFDAESQHNWERPHFCTCGIHRVLSRSQLSFLNDTATMSKIIKSFLADRDEVSEAKLIVSQYYKKTQPIWSIEFFSSSGRRLDGQLQENGQSVLNSLQRLVFDSSSNSIDPVEEVTIKFTQVLFDNLHRLRSKISECEGFNLAQLDAMLDDALKISRTLPEPHYLWEYGGKRVDKLDYTLYSTRVDPLEILVDSMKGMSRSKFRKSFRLPKPSWNQFSQSQLGWALVFWSEYKLKHTHEVISTGPTSPSNYGESMNWTKLCSQLVHFMHDIEIDQTSQQNNELGISISMQENGLWTVEVV